MSGSIPPLRQYAFTAWRLVKRSTGNNLPLFYTYIKFIYIYMPNINYIRNFFCKPVSFLRYEVIIVQTNGNPFDIFILKIIR
jgi:hypothetical protein